MKKLIFLGVALLGFALTADAQCSKGAAAAGTGAACCKGKAASTAATAPATGATTVSADVDRALAADKSVEKRVCSHSGTVSYVRKVSANGKVGFEDVSFDATTGTFASKAKSCGSGAPGAGKCCAKPAGAAKASTPAPTSRT
jgi:hypothetical protein